ncbi:ABC transporter permease [Microbacterium rhizomatis]|uniref:ABC transporter permease n=1 Tax=Microbacterium rhizomatis TaxID=1631477 RepID=A0A5J5J0C2_9MICO|nr:ABC transporter permease [Microbacterium rhizomatis]KAA9107965.1 ABC transporter permease [Microbacterium rhizomatis]
MDAILPWLTTALAVVILATIATTVLGAARVPGPWSIVTAIARAVVQLGLLSLVLAGIIQDPLWVAVGLTVMLVAAIWTAARRSRTGIRGIGPLTASMTLGLLAVMAVVFATGAVDFSPRYALAIGGIIIGNTMTVAVVTERLYRQSVYDHWDEVEGWLAVGASPWESTRELARRSIRVALLPSIDQTRTTGIVVLPGAFVGAIFAGASPFEAGRFQLVVLAGILAAGSLTAVTLLRLTGGIALKPVDPAQS